MILQSHIDISIHAPARGATQKCRFPLRLHVFQSTLPRGERRKQVEDLKTDQKFQSTLPRGERHYMQVLPSVNRHISIHAPARGATVLLRSSCTVVCISIHAPARGATNVVERRLVIVIISIHAPARGATLSFGSSPSFMIFQSTLPRGERLSLHIVQCDVVNISIHAPARGATFAVVQFRLFFIYFNPRSREGSDYHAQPYGRNKDDFNPRSREGSDTPRRSARPATAHFNPRSREGSDYIRAYPCR